MLIINSPVTSVSDEVRLREKTGLNIFKKDAEVEFGNFCFSGFKFVINFFDL